MSEDILRKEKQKSKKKKKKKKRQKEKNKTRKKEGNREIGNNVRYTPQDMLPWEQGLCFLLYAFLTPLKHSTALRTQLPWTDRQHKLN